MSTWLDSMVDDPTRGDPGLPAMIEQAQLGWFRSNDAAMVLADWLDEHGDATRAGALRRGWYPVMIGGAMYLLPPTDPPNSAQDVADRADALSAYVSAVGPPPKEPEVTYRSR